MSSVESPTVDEWRYEIARAEISRLRGALHSVRAFLLRRVPADFIEYDEIMDSINKAIAYEVTK